MDGGQVYSRGRVDGGKQIADGEGSELLGVFAHLLAESHDGMTKMNDRGRNYN